MHTTYEIKTLGSTRFTLADKSEVYIHNDVILQAADDIRTRVAATPPKPPSEAQPSAKTFEVISRVVVENYGVTPSAKRVTTTSEKFGAFAYLARRLTGATFEDIGHYCRAHGSPLRSAYIAYKDFVKAVQNDPALREAIHGLYDLILEELNDAK